VRTAVILLRRSADDPALTGELTRSFPGEAPYLTFRYQVVRVWQMPPEVFLGGGLGVLPLAPLSQVAEADLPAMIGRMEQRLRAETTPDEAAMLWTAADVLMGLRYPRELVARLLQGVHGMKDSVTYQAIVEEGVVKGRQDALIRLGRRQLGSPDAGTLQALSNITDPDRLARLLDRLLDVSSWDELLAVP
jgi:hypothetical protein